jgi:putative polyhydroxyalkanoate system protein
LPHIHITRPHALGLAEARKLAFKWAETAAQHLDMECTYEEGLTSDRVSFKRTGAHGELKVTKDQFVLDARLGLLIGAFRHRIETEIVRNLDLLLAHEEPLKAFETAVAKHAAARKAKHHRKKA